jgi:hypothetical protein
MFAAGVHRSCGNSVAPFLLERWLCCDESLCIVWQLQRVAVAKRKDEQ